MPEAVRHSQFDRGESGRTELLLLTGFELRRDGCRIELPQSAERLLAFLALHDRPQQRSRVAGSLWLDATDSHSAGSLRSALWRIHTVDAAVVQATSTRLRLDPRVRVDLRDGMTIARRLLDDSLSRLDGIVGAELVAALDGDLLPDWYGDDWLVLPREQWRQLRLHALEVLASRLVTAGDFAAAVTAALAAVRGEPLRESAHRCLASVHLAEGNVGEALETYRRFQRLLRAELAVEPSPQFTDLFEGLTAGHRVRPSG